MDTGSTTSIDSAASVGYSETVAYIAASTDLFDEILRDGYRVSRREFVPCSFSPQAALDGYIKWHKNIDDVSVLEVRGLPETLLDREKGRILAKHLAPEFLSDGSVYVREVSDYAEAGCPFCGVTPGKDLAAERGRVGVYRFFKRAYMVSPCPACVKGGKLSEREERLKKGETLLLYHQTNEAKAMLIKQTGKMIRGSGGIAGGAMYFAKKPVETEWKALQKGVVLECEVRLGNPMATQRNPPGTTFASLCKAGFDSLIVDRGINKELNKHSGFEYVVFSWDQVTVLREVARVPVPPGGV